MCGAQSWRRSRRAVSRPQVAQARDIRVEKDAMDSVICDSEQERCEWRLLVVEDDRRLAIELVYFSLQVRAAGCRRNERGYLPSALERRLKVANAADTPASGPAIRDHHRVVRQHRDERVKVPCSCGLCERREQAPVRFRRGGEQALLLRHVLSRSLEELPAGRLAFTDQRRDLVVFEIEYVAEQQYRALGRRQALEHNQERH